MREHADCSRPELNQTGQNHTGQNPPDNQTDNRPGNRTDLHQAYALVFAGEAGQQVLADLSRQGFLHETSFSPDPQRAAFNEGRRSLALYIGHMLAGPEPRRQAKPVAAGGTGKR